jgi:acyl-[acyl-carrier-protein]-phospholipid O-acyltransferase/long-chain-fatty-acid--[acyl-carrier-protein] ligase
MLDFSVPSVILVISMLNLFVAFLIYRIAPETRVMPVPFIRTLLKVIFDKLYRVEVKGIENFKNAGDKVVIVANHNSYIDPPLLGVYLDPKIIFAVNTDMFNLWWMKYFAMKIGQGYPIDQTNPMAMKTLISEIQKGRKIAIFPEGRISTTGSVMKIYDGPGMIAARSGAVLLPVRIDGLEHTWFAKTSHIPKRRITPKVTITVLPPIKLDVPGEMASRDKRKYLTNKLYDIMCEMIFESADTESTIFQSLIDASKLYGARTRIAQDTERKSSYRDLIKRSFILGKYIGLMLPNSVGAVIAFYAMQAYGRVPAMINFSSGTSNCLHAVSVLKLRVIYTSRKFINKAELGDLAEALQEKCKVIYLEDVIPAISIVDKFKGFAMGYFPNIMYNNFMWNDLGSDSPAAALFTSGSEGVPKAVILSHKNIQSNRWQITSRFDFNVSDKAFVALPMFHCFGLTGTILMMMQGIRTFLYPSPLHYAQIPELIYEVGSTIFLSTDTFLNGYSKYAHPYDFYSLKYVISGAEKLMPETRKLWFKKYGLRILEGYGVTEASPVIAANSMMNDKPGTVGRFMPQIEYKIKSVEGMKPGSGILCIKGPNVMKGYIFPSNPGVIARPSDPDFGDGWYETGDIVSVDNEGFVTILGRKKRFAKIAGEMVPLSAIEGVASEADPLGNHAVMNIRDKRKGEQIILFTTGKVLNRDTMLEALRSRDLTELYLPKHFVSVDEIPLLATGKTNYRELLEMAEEFVKSQKKK